MKFIILCLLVLLLLFVKFICFYFYLFFPLIAANNTIKRDITNSSVICISHRPHHLCDAAIRICDVWNCERCVLRSTIHFPKIKYLAKWHTVIVSALFVTIRWCVAMASPSGPASLAPLRFQHSVQFDTHDSRLVISYTSACASGECVFAARDVCV